MIRVEFAPAVSEDFAGIAQHLLKHEAGLAQERKQEIGSGLRVLKLHPEIGRRLDSQHRELVLGRGSRGYVGEVLLPCRTRAGADHRAAGAEGKRVSTLRRR